MSSQENTATGEILLYQTEDGRTRIYVRLKDETLWLTQMQMAELFQKDKRTISEHIINVYEEGDLSQEATVRCHWNRRFILTIQNVKGHFWR